MKYTTSYVVGIACGIIVGLLALALVRKKLYGKALSRPAYAFDERQQLARGEAYKAAFYTAMGWMILSALIRDWLDTSVQMTMGICLSVGVFAVVCVRNDAYLSLRDKPKACIRWFLFLALFNLVPFVLNMLQGQALIEDGVVTWHATNLIVALLLIVVSIAVVLRQRQIRLEAQSEEDA